MIDVSNRIGIDNIDIMPGSIPDESQIMRDIFGEKDQESVQPSKLKRNSLFSKAVVG